MTDQPSALQSNEAVLDADEILDGILEWVEIESPSHDGVAVNRVVDKVESEQAALGAKMERIPGRDGFGDILVARTPWGGDGPGILVLSHLDTVHAIGIIDKELKVRREDDKVYGPGIYDMKSGAYIAMHAYRHLVRTGRETPLPITFLYVPEEEIGSPTSRKMIVDLAKQNKYVLVTEPARDGGKIVTARNGRLKYDIVVTGRPSHAGMKHMEGRSAIKEMAHQILALEALTDYDRGITCSVGTISGGTLTNVVPAHCEITVEMRVPDMDAAKEIEDKVAAMKPVDPDCILDIQGGIDRPPYEKFEGIEKLFNHAKELAAEIGFELDDVKTGGGSDGNFTGALGIPTLDGLGADGHGAHSHDEFIYYSSLVERTKLMVRLFETLE
ncbi:MAG: carboxypeptidase [Rhodospirillaceae bacterium]|nr:carboxypeptidase [Rhodospirillaceae bacterium]